eukprot:CAMPEP_0198221170 /NCGR_PEP_ID=MMETSP1445-20131203/82472_1 /TAXON_ID=36898 /ORGANISM="Pyramimonas sp., Strain CCMP2087" /LENGTH=363 /DNA_ID=CAMNT_0043899209 /DNA_START=196 /DNA_END=1284 /DNA_ORIENTATION=-
MRIADYELCRHGGDGAGGAAVLGASLGSERNQAIVTVEKEGVLCYDVSTQNKVCGWPLGGKSDYSFATPAVWDPSSSHYFAVLEQRRSGASTSSDIKLVSWPTNPPGTPLSQLPTTSLPSAVHSIFPATSCSVLKKNATADTDDDTVKTATAIAGGVIVVGKSGTVSHHNVKGQVLSRIEAEKGADGNILLSTVVSSSDDISQTLATSTRIVLVSALNSKKGSFMGQIFGFERAVGTNKRDLCCLASVELRIPKMPKGVPGEEGMQPVAAACVDTRLSVLWSSNMWTVYELPLGAPGAPRSAQKVDLTPVITRHLPGLPSASSSSSAPPVTPGRTNKRRAAAMEVAAATGVLPRVSCAWFGSK